jgi:hypothetical protein
VRRRLEKQQDHLFTFLEVEEVETTNNLAERQLRPAVIARKVSCGNKTPQGAHTWEILTSLAATCVQQANPSLNSSAGSPCCQLRAKHIPIMKQRFYLYRRGKTFYLQDSRTGKQQSLETKDRKAALRLLEIKRQTVADPAFNQFILTDVIRFSHGASTSRKIYRSSFIPGLHDVCMVS